MTADTDTPRDPRALAAPIVFLDTETTGLNRRTRRIWEVAAIRREPDGSESRYVAMVDGVDLSEADPFALRIGRFYERHPAFNGTLAAIDHPYPRSGRLPDGAVLAFLGDIADAVERITRGAHLVGAVPSFDEETLAALLHEFELCPAWHYHLIDVENLAAGVLGWQPPYDSAQLSAALDVDRDGYAQHTALGDAEWARDLYDAVMRWPGHLAVQQRTAPREAGKR